MEVKNKEVQHSLFWEIIKDSKETIKRVCKTFTIVLCLLIFLWSATVIYLIYVLNDIGIEEITTETTTSQEIKDVDNINNSYIINGDNNGDN